MKKLVSLAIALPLCVEGYSQDRKVSVSIGVATTISVSGLEYHKTGSSECNPCLASRPNPSGRDAPPAREYTSTAGNGEYSQSASLHYPITANFVEQNIWAGAALSRPGSRDCPINRRRRRPGSSDIIGRDKCFGSTGRECGHVQSYSVDRCIGQIPLLGKLSQSAIRCRKAFGRSKLCVRTVRRTTCSGPTALSHCPARSQLRRTA